jgi:hypothetical protein
MPLGLEKKLRKETGNAEPKHTRGGRAIDQGEDCGVEYKRIVAHRWEAAGTNWCCIPRLALRRAILKCRAV